MALPDRRRYPRVKQSIPFQVGHALGWIQARTVNLSCGGILCALDQPIPLMSKLEICLDLPNASEDNPTARVPIRCTGVVVRQEHSSDPQDPMPYRMAICFTHLDPSDRHRLAEWILEAMLHHDHRSSQRDQRG